MGTVPQTVGMKWFTTWCSDSYNKGVSAKNCLLYSRLLYTCHSLKVNRTPSTHTEIHIH